MAASWSVAVALKVKVIFGVAWVSIHGTCITAGKIMDPYYDTNIPKSDPPQFIDTPGLWLGLLPRTWRRTAG